MTNYRGGYHVNKRIYYPSSRNPRPLDTFDMRNKTIKNMNRSSLNTNKQAKYNQYMNLNATRKNAKQKQEQYENNYINPIDTVKKIMELNYNKKNSKGKANIRESVRKFLNVFGVNTKNMNKMTLKNKLTPGFLKKRYLNALSKTKSDHSYPPDRKENYNAAFMRYINASIEMEKLQKELV